MAIPRLLAIGWLEEIPDNSNDWPIPQEPAPIPQEGAAIPQATDDRARGPVPFRSVPFRSEGGPGETKPPKATQADHDRAAAVARLYPAVASKDKRAISFPLHALNLLAARIALHPAYAWEEHAKLEAHNPTPLGGQRWVEDMPNPVALERLRKAAPTPRKEYFTA